MSPAATASLPALQPPAYQRHDTPLASSRSPMVGCVSGCFMTVLTRCGGYGGSGVFKHTRPDDILAARGSAPAGPATRELHALALHAGTVARRRKAECGADGHSA